MARYRPRPIVTLTTDFGLSDHYVGVLHGVILRINPNAVIIDLCHGVLAQDVSSASLLLGDAFRFFPKDTIHVAIVDPDVGGARQAVAVASQAGMFVGPDNGVFSEVIRAEAEGLASTEGDVAAGQLAPHIQAVQLVNNKYWLPRVSSTFHGRDIFAPVAAHLSLGVPLAAMGKPAGTVHLLSVSHPVRQADGTLIAHVVRVDHFGNLITDLTAAQAAGLPQPLRFEIGTHTVHGIQMNYGACEGLVAVIGSSDRVEIALSGGSAASHLQGKAGTEVLVRTASLGQT